jgi:hypothetical protein
LAGLPVVVIGLLLSPPPAPDLLMSEDGRVLGLRDERGMVHVASMRTDRFVSDAWARRQGQEGAKRWTVSADEQASGLGCATGLCRWRKGPWRIALVSDERRLAMSAVLRKLRPSDAEHHSENQRIATQWISDRKVYDEAMMILAQSGLDHECVTATAVTSAAKALEAVDKFEGTAVARRDAAMRELQRQREEVFVSPHNGPLIDAEQTSQTSKMGGKA